MGRAKNPLLPLHWYIPDGEAHVFDGELFLYGSCDRTKEHFCSGEYYVAHTKNFADWDIEGPSYTTQEVTWGGESKMHSSVHDVTSFDELPEHIKNYLPESAREVPIEQIIQAIEQQASQNLPKEKLLYAPDAIQKDGKTYLYLSLSDDTEGVAVADSPTGPFTDSVQMQTSVTHTSIEGIDPAVFVDEDGQGYYYWGQFQAKGARLTEDMCAIEEGSVVERLLTEEQHHFHEGSSMRKRGDTYYYVFADTSRGKPTCLGYATGKSPLGPFTYQGIIIDNKACDPGSWNNHGSIEEVNGQWYVFYHRSCGNSQHMRRACAEPIFFDEKGLIQEVKMTSQGPGAPFALGEEISGYCACEVSGTAYVGDDTEKNALVIPDGAGGAVFRYVKNETAAQRLIFSAEGSGNVEVFADGQTIGTGRLESGEIPVSLETGMHEICLKFSDVKQAAIHQICFH